jgi:hypothetical protein
MLPLSSSEDGYGYSNASPFSLPMHRNHASWRYVNTLSVLRQLDLPAPQIIARKIQEEAQTFDL